MQRTIPVRATRSSDVGPIRIVLVGLGPIGRAVADQCLRLSEPVHQVVGAIDIKPEYQGKTLGDVWGDPGRRDASVPIVASAPELSVEADVAIVTTTSRLESLEPQLEPLFARRLHVVSSSEELFYPWLTDASRAERIDAMARNYGVRVSGTGINPGFLMDVLPAVMTMATNPPYAMIRCERYVDLAQRRLPLQAKAGLGKSAEEFRDLADRFRIGHVGLVESVAYLAGQVDAEIDRIVESLEPVPAPEALSWQGQSYPVGTVIGFEHQAWGLAPGQSESDLDQAPLQLYLIMRYPHPEPRDRVFIEGDPQIDLTIRPCVLGDSATAAVLLHLAGQTARAEGQGVRLPHQVGLGHHGPTRRISPV